MNADNYKDLYQHAYLAQVKANKLYKRKQQNTLRKNLLKSNSNKENSVYGFLHNAVVKINVSPNQRIGYEAEQLALQYLESQGLTLLRQNLLCKVGELDLVMRHSNTLVFLEVRKRCSSKYGGSAASINLNKKRRLHRAALYFLPYIVKAHFHGVTPPCRFDVIAIDSGNIHWIKQAFSLNVC